MMSDRFAADITRGSIWRASDGSHARVMSVCAGYVSFARRGVIDRMHHHVFRNEFERPYDARRLRSQFSMTLNNLVSFHAFWGLTSRRLYARASNVRPEDCRTASRGRPALPADAVYVGQYSDAVIMPRQWHGPQLTAYEKFLQDLHDVLAEHPHVPRAA